MAEERAEILQGELDAAKDRIEELEIDLNILREQVESGAGAMSTPTAKSAVDGAASEPTSANVKQLQQKNERLTEALVK